MSTSRPAEPPATIAARIGPALLERWRQLLRGDRAAAADIAALGQRLRRRGLSARAVAHCFGGASVVHAPLRARAEPPATIPPAALLAHLMVAGSVVPEPQARRWLGDDLEQLIDLGLIAASAGAVFATVALMPVGEALVVSDRADVLGGGDCALYADDSAFHALGAVPGRARRPAARWLDVGTGSAVIPLARPAAAAHIRGTDINPRALAMAALGAALSGLGHLELCHADLLQAAGGGAPWDLITFNAPLPAGPGSASAASLYRAGPADLVPRFHAELGERYRAGGLLAPGGEVIVHSWQWGEYPACLQLPGRVIAGRYTPPGFEPALGVTLWQPDRPAEARMIQLGLTPAAPHVMRSQLDAG